MTSGLPPSAGEPPQLPGTWTPAAPAEPQSEPAGAGGPEPETKGGLRGWASKVGGPIGLVALLLWKFGRVVLVVLGKVALLFKIPLLGTIISAGVSIAGYALLYGWAFGAAIVGSLLVHELGHVWQIRREGIPVKALNFVPFLGAYVAHEGTDDEEAQARISIAGPIAGALVAGAAWVAADGQTGLLLAIAYTGFYINAFNLVPFGFLDGAGATGLLTRGWWLVVAVATAAVAAGSHNVFAIILALLAAGKAVFSRRHDTWELRPDDGISFSERANAALLYVGVIAVCAFGMAATYADRTRSVLGSQATVQSTISTSVDAPPSGIALAP